MQGGYRNLSFLLLALPLVIVAGFWIPYFSEFPKFDPSITAAVHVHAVLLFAWVVLLVIQPFTIRRRAFSFHRALGKASYALMPLLLLSSVVMLHKECLENMANGMNLRDACVAEYLSTAQLALLATFFVLAIARIRRRDVAEHMRYMLCIALVLLPAGLARTLGYWFDVGQAAAQTVCLVLIDLCLLLLIVFDRRRHFPPRPYIVALTAYLVVETGWFALGRPI